MLFKCVSNRCWTQSLNKKGAASIARVAPMLLAKETIKVPMVKPKIAPPARDNAAAPGRERVVVTR